MKINYLMFSFMVLAQISFAQIGFEKGYFINSKNQRIDCQIKNLDWKNNPGEFEYKLTADGIVEKGNLSNTKEFGIIGFSKYVKADTKIDLSPSEIDEFYKERNPEWSQQTLFLKVLVEGKANLYSYTKGSLIRFFYSVSDSSINQLIYKEYYVTSEKIAENLKFREQLWMDVRLANADMNSLENISYYESDLKRYFKKYNEASGNPTKVFNKKEKRDTFNLKICPGFNYSSVSVSSSANERFNTDFGNQLTFRIGIESEFILPFNRNKWSFLFEPTYQYFYSEKQKPTYKASIHLNSIEIPFGIRYYSFLNQDMKLFADIIFVPGLSMNFNSTFEKQSLTESILPTVLELQPGPSFAFGGGIVYKKYSAEFRYYTNKDLLREYASWYTDYKRFSLILGYRIF